SNSVQLLAAVRDQLSLFLSRASPLPRPRGLSLENASSPLSSDNASNALSSENGSNVRSEAGPSGLPSEGAEAGPSEPGVVARRGRCYGCSGRFVSDALELLEQVIERPKCKQEVLDAGLLQAMVTSGLLEAMVTSGMQAGGVMGGGREARSVICALVRDSAERTAEALAMVTAKVVACLAHSKSIDLEDAVVACLVHSKSIDLEDAVQAEMQVKYKALLEILFRAVEAGAHQTNIAQGLILPSLRILARITTLAPSVRTQNGSTATNGSTAANGSNAAPEAGDRPEAGPRLLSFSSPGVATPGVDVTLAANEEAEEPPMSYGQWQPGASGSGLGYDALATMDAAGRRALFLARKYGGRWLRRSVVGRRRGGGGARLMSEGWIRALLLNKCSQAVRAVAKEVLAAMAGAGTQRSLVLLDLAVSMLGEAADAGVQSAELFSLLTNLTAEESRRNYLVAGGSAELFSLLTNLTAEESRRNYLVADGFLPTLCALITREVARIRAQEAIASCDIAQGQVLKSLLALLESLLKVPGIRSRFKLTPDLLATMLDNFLHVQSLIVQVAVLKVANARLHTVGFEGLVDP
ncbi:hypothetical protein T484DRAFT_1842398, partial [Baffinella frigidus]